MSLAMTLLLWGSLVLVLFITTFGFNAFIVIVSSLAFILLGCFVALKSNLKESRVKNPTKYEYILDTKLRFNFGGRDEMVGLIDRESPSCSPYRRKRRSEPLNGTFTGELEIDDQIKDVLHLFFRDYVYSWYSFISPGDQEFPEELRSMVQMVVKVISQRVRNIDKVSYITTKLVDDFASHLRLYRFAKQKETELKVEDPNVNLLSIFFDIELQMEQNNLCRDKVSEDNDVFLDYLYHVCDILQYLVLPPDCFSNRPLRCLLRSLIVNTILYPVFDLFSDPDFVNQTIIWICNSKAPQSLSSESFLTVLRCSDDADDLTAVREMVAHEMAILRSRDTGGDDDFDIKQQLSSLNYVNAVIRNRLDKLKDGANLDNDPIEPPQVDVKKYSGKLINLPFETVLKNNVALSHFIEYMGSIKAQGYIYFYLNVEGFRVSAEQQLAELALVESAPSGHRSPPSLESLREAAINIYDTYLAPEKAASHKLQIDELVSKRINIKIKNEPMSETWFDEAANQIFRVMREADRFYPSFKKSIYYIKMLEDLELLKDGLNNNHKSNGDNDKDNQSADSVSIGSLDEVNEVPEFEPPIPASVKPDLIAEIDSTGVVREFGNEYAVYAITVWRRKENQEKEEKCYHQNTLDKFAQLAKLTLPGKRTFNNMSQEFLEQRKHLLNSYLKQMVRIWTNRNDIKGFKEHLLRFLEPGNYEVDKSSKLLSKTVDKLVFNPFKSSVKSMGNAVNAVKAGGDNILDKLSRLGSLGSSQGSGSGASGTPPQTPILKNRSFSSQQSTLSVPVSSSIKMTSSGSCSSLTSTGSAIDSSKVAANLDLETEDNIPLRIMLLLMDEVFDLKNKNLWLRRRIVAMVRQIIQATSGDTINRKIVDHVEELTSAHATAEYIKSFKQSFWPNGFKAGPRPERSLNTKCRTRVAAKMMLLTSLSDDLKHIIGNETTRRGLLCVHEMFQHQTLNRRLVLVLFEGLLNQLFPDNYFPQILEKLHSVSGRKEREGSSTASASHAQKRNPWPPYLSAKFHGEANFGPKSAKSSKSVSPATSTKGSPVTVRPKLK